MFTNWNFWLSVVTASVAITALLQTHQQIKLNNKQHLFDKRVENYLIAIGLIQLYRNSYISFEKDEPFLAIDFEFSQLTNNTYLEQITQVINNPLKQPEHKEFLIKMENLKDIATKIKFLFAGKTADLLGDFVTYYAELLFAMYQYKILLVDMKKVSEDFKLTFEKSQQTVDEKRQRLILQKAFDNLKQADIILKKENVEKQIKKQIKL